MSIKVLLCERDLTGHRKAYLDGLCEMQDIEFFVFVPNKKEELNNHSYFFNTNKENTFVEYCLWIKKIREIVEKEKIDIVHILDGDGIMRYFGLFMNFIRCKKIIITFHHFFKGFIRKISYKLMYFGKSKMFVVHTENFKKELEKNGITNVSVCNYPSFGYESICQLSNKECKIYYGLDTNDPIIGIVGGLNKYKNIIKFLEVLNHCDKDFYLLIFGKPNDVSSDEIERAIHGYKKKTKTIYRTLTDEEYYKAIVASDIVYSVYGLDFDGASGPLIDGVCARKMILASSHGSLGDVVSSNHLGLTADVSKNEDVLGKTNKAIDLAKGFCYDDSAENYRQLIQPKLFINTYRNIYLNCVQKE